MLSRWEHPEISLIIWSLLALASLLPVSLLVKGSFPIFTVLWILVPLVVVVKTKDASRAGFRAVPLRELIRVTGINLVALFLVTVFVESWSHTYQGLVEIALASQTPDTTFAWLLRYPRCSALGGMALYSGLVTLFGEELFFRGWLLQAFQKRMKPFWAVILQAVLFVIPNLIAAFLLPPLQGVLYALVYTFLGIGVIGGWAALRTQSIWPSLVSATLLNLLFVAAVV